MLSVGLFWSLHYCISLIKQLIFCSFGLPCACYVWVQVLQTLDPAVEFQQQQVAFSFFEKDFGTEATAHHWIWANLQRGLPRQWGPQPVVVLLREAIPQGYQARRSNFHQKSKWVKCAARLPATCCCSCQLPKPAFKSLPSSKRDCSPWQHCRLQPQQPLPECFPKLCAPSSCFFFKFWLPELTMYTVSKPVSPVILGTLKLSLCVLNCPSWVSCGAKAGAAQELCA